MDFFQKIATLLFSPEKTTNILKAALPTPAGPSSSQNFSSKSFKGQNNAGKSIKAIGRGSGSSSKDEENFQLQRNSVYLPPAALQNGREVAHGLNGQKPMMTYSARVSGHYSNKPAAGYGNYSHALKQQSRVPLPKAGLDVAIRPSAEFDSSVSRVTSNYSASGSGISAAEFGRKRSTRTVSKINYNRSSKPNNGKRSAEAERASQDLFSLAAVGNESSLAAFRGCLDRWSNQLRGLDDYTYLMKELGSRGGGMSSSSSEKALAVFEWLADKSQQGMRLIKGPSEWGKLASAAISVLGRLGNVRAARKVFDRARLNGMGGNVFAYSALISAYGRSGRCAEALEMFERMKSENCKPNLITYNALIDACSKGGMPDKARALFTELQESGLEPDKITFNSLMGAYGRAGQWQEAENVFEMMGSAGLAQDLHSYNTLIDAFCKGGQVAMAVQFLQSMEYAGVEPNVITYSSIIDGYAKAGRESDAEAMFSKMREIMKRHPGQYPDSVCFNTMLDMYGKAGRIEEAMAVRAEMEAAGLGTDLVSFNALIDMMGKYGRPHEAARLFEQMKRKGHVPNVLTWSAIIGAYARAGNHAEAMKYFHGFKRAGLQPDVVLYSLLIDVLGKHGLVQDAMTLLKEMVANGIPPNVVTYNSLIDAYGRLGQVDRAVTTMDEMKSRGLSPNTVTFNCVIDAYGKEGKPEEALKMVHRMRNEGQSPDPFTVSSLIDANARNGDAWAAVKIFREMQEWGVQPNVVTFSAVLNVCRWLSSLDEAVSLLTEAKRSDAKIYGLACGLLLGEGSTAEFWDMAESVFEFVDREDRDRDRLTGMAFYNALLDLLWHFRQRQGSLTVLRIAMRRQVYQVPCWTTEAEGGLDLHQMSVGAALTMLHSWLQDLFHACARGGSLPKLLSVLTGWGKHSKVVGESSVKREVDSRLTELGSPFSVSKTNEGRIVSAGAAVRAWLLSPRVRDMIALWDDRRVEGGMAAVPAFC